MKAYFSTTTIYKGLKTKPYKLFEIVNSEIEEVRKKGGFVVGVVNKTTAPISPKQDKSIEIVGDTNSQKKNNQRKKNPTKK